MTVSGCWRGAERVRLFTRNGHDWTERFPLIVEALYALKATTCLIDGEAVTCATGGLADFDRLRYGRGDVHLCALVWRRRCVHATAGRAGPATPKAP